MHEKEIYRWVVFGLLIVHFLISSTMWIINDTGKSVTIPKTNSFLQKISHQLKNNSRIYLLSVITIGISILFVSLVIFEKPLYEGLDNLDTPNNGDGNNSVPNNSVPNNGKKITTGRNLKKAVTTYGQEIGKAFGGRTLVNSNESSNN